MLQRQSPRLRDWDYATPGAYFVTVVTHDRQSVFGAIDEQGRMTLSDLGAIAEAEWWRTCTLLRPIESPVFVLMPNHVHGIVVLAGAAAGPGAGSPPSAGGASPSPTP